MRCLRLSVCYRFMVLGIVRAVSYYDHGNYDITAGAGTVLHKYNFSYVVLAIKTDRR